MYNDNLARKYAPEKRGHEISVARVRTTAKTRKKVKLNIGNTLKLGVLLFVFVMGSFLVLTRNVKVTEQGKRVSELKAEHSLLETENRKLEIDISRKVDIATVEERAISSCNMNRARQGQIMYVDVQAEDYGVVNSKKEKHDNSGIMWGLLAYLK